MSLVAMLNQDGSWIALVGWALLGVSGVWVAGAWLRNRGD